MSWETVLAQGKKPVRIFYVTFNKWLFEGKGGDGQDVELSGWELQVSSLLPV